MSAPLTDIRRLLPMLDMAFQAEQAKMARIIARMRELSQQLQSLEHPQSFDPSHAASLGGADVRWERWVEDRKVLIQRELALAARDREQAKDHVIAALSKLEAAKQMEARASSDARQTVFRRSQW